MDESDVTLRPRFSKVLTVLVCAIVVLSLGTLVVTGNLTGLARGSAPLLLLAYVSWMLFWAPSVRISPAGVEFVNLIRTHRVTWPAIARIETKYALTLHTKSRRYVAWAAPSAGRHAAAKLSRAETIGLPETTYSAENRIGLGDIPTSDSGVAGYYVRRQWETYRDAGLLDLIDGTGVVTTWHRTTITILIALVVLSVLGGAL
jgi:hypothetical protein